MHAIDECYDADRVGEHFVPLSERFVGGPDRGALLIAARDDFEQQIGVARVGFTPIQWTVDSPYWSSHGMADNSEPRGEFLLKTAGCEPAKWLDQGPASKVGQ